jgi:hypothetical protein
MTKQQMIRYIRKDLRQIAKERRVVTPKKPASCENETIRNYLATREHTLKEILNLFS